ncbi:MAG TPA: hypothetical protein VM101_06895 [Flavitalea sp.]|nr:hypothetical protein [Flavitalea sp.]
MKPVVFFVFMLSLLFSGSAHVYAGHPHHTANKLQQKYTTDHNLHNLIKNTSVDGQDQFLIDDEIEDEYTNTGLARKIKPITRQYLIFDDPCLLSYLRNFFGDQHSFSAASLSRYITQRVLRL